MGQITTLENPPLMTAPFEAEVVGASVAQG
jgi:hypothetical protein